MVSHPITCHLLAWELLDLGQDVILEFGFWSRFERDGLRETARKHNFRVELYFLDVPFEELARRIIKRNADGGEGIVPIKREKLEEYARVFQAPSDEELALFDEPTVLHSRKLVADNTLDAKT
jgi:predicted kinase